MTIINHNGLEVDPSKLTETVQVKSSSLGALSLQESDSGETFIMPRIESIHAGRTANHVFYPADKLKGDKKLGSGVYSWTEPYAKPVIYNHDMSTEVTGRVERAAYSEYTQAGVPGIIVVPKITQKDAVEAVRDGRLLTVSIGAETNSAVCSICGTDIINEGYCGHMKGEEYDGHTAEWIVGDLFFQELSWVNQPADSNAFVVDSDVSQEVAVKDTKESKENQSINEYYGVPAAFALTESIAVNMNEKEDTSEVSKNKVNPLDELKEATKNAKSFLEAIELSIEEVEIKAGESVVLKNSGDEIPEGATVSVSSDKFSIEINEDNQVVLTALEDIEAGQFDLTVSVKAGNQTTSVVIPVTVMEVEEDEDEKKGKDGETDEDNKDDKGEVVDDEEGEEGKEDDDEEKEDDEVDPADDPNSEDEVDPIVEPEEDNNEEKDNAISEAVEAIQTLQASNQLLKEQVRLLTGKLRESYINKIVDKYDGDLSEEYIGRLEGRKLESLEETIQDLDSGFLKVKPEEKTKEARTVKKVVNPLKENDKSKEPKEITEQDKINVYKNFLNLK